MKPKECGAKTKAGTPCKRAPTLVGRCNLHGGKSLIGMSHPNYKHGLYSKYSIEGMFARMAVKDARRRKKLERRLAKERAEREAIEAAKLARRKPELEWNEREIALIMQIMNEQDAVGEVRPLDRCNAMPIRANF